MHSCIQHSNPSIDGEIDMRILKPKLKIAKPEDIPPEIRAAAEAFMREREEKEETQRRLEILNAAVQKDYVVLFVSGRILGISLYIPKELTKEGHEMIRTIVAGLRGGSNGADEDEEEYQGKPGDKPPTGYA